MAAEQKRQYIAGGALLLIVAAFILAVFLLLSQTDKTDVYLADTDSQRQDWRYEVLVGGEVREYEPQFADEYTLVFPEGTEAVRLTRTLGDVGFGDQLKWGSGIFGAEAYLDGVLLFSDFQGAAHEESGFLADAPEQAQAFFEQRASAGVELNVQLDLPWDCAGKDLSLITYFAPGWDGAQPIYPFLGAYNSEAVRMTTDSVVPIAMATVSAILAVLLAGVFLLDVSNGGADGRTLLLCLYYVLLFLDQAYQSEPGYYSVLTERLNLSFLHGLYIAPLYLFLALRLKKPWKHILCGAVTAWAIYEGVQMFLNIRQSEYAITGRNGLGAFALFLVFAVLFAVRAAREGKKRRGTYAVYGLIVGVSVLVYVQYSILHSEGQYLLSLWYSLLTGNFLPIVSLAAGVSAMPATVVLLAEFVRRTLRQRQEMSALEERGRQTLESYERLLNAQEATNAVNHEMRHHMTALTGILSGGDIERARRYVDAVADELDRIPDGQYSQNLLVNAIAGSYLDRARAEGVRVEHMLPVPRKLAIADEDLCVLLSNMLQNALDACRRMSAEADRYIQVEMSVFKEFLFVKCVNSAPASEGNGAETIEKHRPGHGYGLTAMQRVAKKYGSILTVKQPPGTFSVQTSLCLANEPER